MGALDAVFLQHLPDYPLDLLAELLRYHRFDLHRDIRCRFDFHIDIAGFHGAGHSGFFDLHFRDHTFLLLSGDKSPDGFP